MQKTESLSHIRWFVLHSGKICLGNKPTREAFARLSSLGVTHLATVQTSDESAYTMRDKTLEAGLEWLWVPFMHPSVDQPSDDIHLHQYLHELSQMLTEGARIYLHCDGSHHRCGLLFYALCHYCRVPSNSAYNALHSFGPVAANNLPRAKLAWAAKLGHSAPRS